MLLHWLVRSEYRGLFRQADYNESVPTDPMHFSAVIFDFNGVLLWDSPFHEEAWQVAAQTLRRLRLSPAEFAEHVHGRPISYTLGYLTGRKICGQELVDLTELKESLYRRLCLEHPERFVLSPGAIPLLENLMRGRVAHTIATSSEITNLRFFVEKLALANWFDPTLIAYDDGHMAGKPAPDIYLRAAAKLGVEPAQCVVVEDSLSGIESARQAGMGCIIALGPEEQHATLRACPGVSQAIVSLEQFPLDLLPPIGGD